jgi:hypothetical protein
LSSQCILGRYAWRIRVCLGRSSLDHPRWRSTPQHEQLEQVPRFEEIVDEPTNSYQQAEIIDITDGLSQVVDDELVHGGAAGGQVRDGLGGGGDRVQARKEPGLDDRHHGEQVQEEGLGGDDHRGQAHADAGFGGGHQEEQVLAGAGLGGDEEGGDDIRGEADQSLLDLGYYDAVELHGRYSGTRLFCDEFKSKFCDELKLKFVRRVKFKCFKTGLSTQRGEGGHT